MTEPIEFRVQALEDDLLELANMFEQAVGKLAEIATFAGNLHTRIAEIEARLNLRS